MHHRKRMDLWSLPSVFQSEKVLSRRGKREQLRNLLSTYYVPGTFHGTFLSFMTPKHPKGGDILVSH